ncbi:hypothetical protein N7532_000487 [Penicillium argentinense]|uniref:RNA polymerase II subunit B1 CTD phosphatase RPAP2 homolog n=1 Tax=Penicillium argentinense TaxID=1131581 RepID=A0A9W9KNW9_9EURO|nr:uncharacterized protein N7532_000487 [Penicillium argentinense]KAJ5112442.1 hypothetical protein N7532_000487 [Penicillium argentinense]
MILVFDQSEQLDSMASGQGPSQNSALRTSLPSAFAAVNAEQSSLYAPPSQEEQERYLQARPGATPQHLGIALQHAHQIQTQKEAEDMILDRIIDLLAIPASPSADPAAPSTEEEQIFRSAMKSFRPGDFDNLITERNYEDLCGYGLCPRKNRKEANAKGETFHFKYGPKGSGPGGRGRSMEIVPREKLEKWCSDECAERALFIRVQLSEQPVWERRAEATRAIKIELLEESWARKEKHKAKAGSSTSASAPDKVSQADVTTSLENLTIQDTGRSQELAMERGDTALSHQQGRVDIQIKEKEQGPDSVARAPELRPEDAYGGSVEGYIPQERQKQPSDNQDGQDMLDQL